MNLWVIDHQDIRKVIFSYKWIGSKEKKNKNNNLKLPKKKTNKILRMVTGIESTKYVPSHNLLGKSKIINGKWLFIL